jgi:hypothetical protein
LVVGDAEGCDYLTFTESKISRYRPMGSTFAFIRGKWIHDAVLIEA